MIKLWVKIFEFLRIKQANSSYCYYDKPERPCHGGKNSCVIACKDCRFYAGKEG